MRKLIIYILLILLSINIHSQEIVDRIKAKEDSLKFSYSPTEYFNQLRTTTDSLDYVKEIIGGDTVFIYSPKIISTVSSESNYIGKYNTSSNERYSDYESLSHIPESHTCDSGKDVGQITITQVQGQQGALAYAVPIEIHPGSNNFQPNISINYNSLSGNGVAGMGWELGGLSTISVTGSNVYYDGKTEAPINDNQKNFILDGIRLIKLSENTTHIVYQSEQGNIKVISYFPSGKYYFEVYYPNGNKAVYGKENNTSKKVSYPLHSIMNTTGNYIHYTYNEYYNCYYVKTIEYGKGDNKIGSVKFLYEQREDIPTIYSASELLLKNRLLIGIETYFRGDIQKKYTLHHVEKDVKLLDKITCNSFGKEVNPLIFYYGVNHVMSDFSTDRSLLYSFYENTKVKDLTIVRGKFEGKSEGDGIIFYPERSTFGVIRYSSDGKNVEYGSTHHPDQELYIYKKLNGTYAIYRPDLLKADKGFQNLSFVDYKGDGNENLLKLNYWLNGSSPTIQVIKYDSDMKPKTSNFIVDGSFSHGSYKSPVPRTFIYGDFNGDGKVDLLTIAGYKLPIGSPMKTTISLIDIENERFIIKEKQTGDDGFDFNNEEILFPADFDGDGKTDLCKIGSLGGIIVYTLVDDKITYLSSYFGFGLDDFTQKGRKFFLGDLNGDGKTDMLISPEKDAYITETHVGGNGTCMGCCGMGDYQTSADGSVKIYKCYNSSTRYCEVWSEPKKIYEENAYDWTCLYSKGNDFSRTNIILPITNEDHVKCILYDMNGDKIPDLMVSTEGKLKLYLNKKGNISNEPELHGLSLDKDSRFVVGDFSDSWGYTSKNYQLLAIKDALVTHVSFQRNDAVQRLLTGIITSHGIIHKHIYSSMMNNRTYTIEDDNSAFPYNKVRLDLNVIKNVSSFQKEEKISSVTFTYNDAIIVRNGLGFRGFEKIKVKDNLRSQTTVQTFSPKEFGVLKSVDSPFISASYNYKVNVASNKIAKVTLNNKSETDKLKGVTAKSVYEYDAYGIPTKETIDYGGGIKTVTSIVPINIDTADEYILGLPESQTVTTTRDGKSVTAKTVFDYNDHYQPTSKISYYNGNKTSEESFVYYPDGNLQHAKSKTYTASDWLTTAYEYDTYDRITKK
ncbi:hypothetical protein LJC00_03430, partial [Dysgonomonas sp. OttesenSCG-928-M03]|nr:hypothetical protein [Dysgonomonas sp. OttesenSCG-928-M03]